jgi:hypothetical protein
MSSVAEVPVTVSPEAAARVAELGFQPEFEQMIHQLRRTVPGLLRIGVTLEPQYQTDEADRVVIEADMADRGIPYDPAACDYDRWVVTTFRPEVLRHILVMIFPGTADGR